MSSDSEDCTAVGKLFHTTAAVKLNAWPPMVTGAQYITRTLYHYNNTIQYNSVYLIIIIIIIIGVLITRT